MRIKLFKKIGYKCYCTFTTAENSWQCCSVNYHIGVADYLEVINGMLQRYLLHACMHAGLIPVFSVNKIVASFKVPKVD